MGGEDLLSFTVIEKSRLMDFIINYRFKYTKVFFSTGATLSVKVLNLNGWMVLNELQLSGLSK